MYKLLLACSCFLSLSGCFEHASTLEEPALQNHQSPSSTTASATFEYKPSLTNGMPEGFTPPTGPATQALVDYINPSTGQTWTAPSGGYTAPDGWVVNQSVIE
jgi:hypothetical protein